MKCKNYTKLEEIIMKINFKPQRLISSMVMEEKIPNGIRRLIQTDGKHPKTIDMELSRLDSAGESYPKEYYVSSYRVFDTKNSKMLKSLERNVTGTTNSESLVTNLNRNSGKYDRSLIVRNNTTVTNIDLTK